MCMNFDNDVKYVNDSIDFTKERKFVDLLVKSLFREIYRTMWKRQLMAKQLLIAAWETSA